MIDICSWGLLCSTNKYDVIITSIANSALYLTLHLNRTHRWPAKMYVIHHSGMKSAYRWFQSSSNILMLWTVKTRQTSQAHGSTWTLFCSYVATMQEGTYRQPSNNTWSSSKILHWEAITSQPIASGSEMFSLMAHHNTTTHICLMWAATYLPMRLRTNLSEFEIIWWQANI